MPLSNYNKVFGNKPGAAQNAYDAMQQEYGPDKGKKVFYATKNKRQKQPGITSARGRKMLGGM